MKTRDKATSPHTKAGGFETKKAAVKKGWRLLVQTRARGQFQRLRGKLLWEGSLDDMWRDL